MSSSSYQSSILFVFLGLKYKNMLIGPFYSITITPTTCSPCPGGALAINARSDEPVVLRKQRRHQNVNLDKIFPNLIRGPKNLYQALLEWSQAMANFQIPTLAKASGIKISKIMKRWGAATLVSLETILSSLIFFSNPFLTWLSRPPRGTAEDLMSYDQIWINYIKTYFLIITLEVLTQVRFCLSRCSPL